jgi:hypothetical protein
MQCVDTVQLSTTGQSVFKETGPDEFCRKWVPIKKGLSEGQHGYRKAATELLEELCKVKSNSANMWLSKPDRVTPLTKMYLTAVDIIWTGQQTYDDRIDKI